MVLGADFAGFLVRALSLYRQFIHALYQTCLAHLLRRCREMILVARPGGAEFPRTIETILQQSLQLVIVSARADQRTRSRGGPKLASAAARDLAALSLTAGCDFVQTCQSGSGPKTNK